MNGGTGRQRRPGDLADLPGDLAPERVAFAEELRRGRAKVSLSLDVLGQRTLSSKASVSRWLNGRALPSKDQAVAWARACGTDETTIIRLWEAAAAVPASQGEPAPAERTLTPARRASSYRSLRSPAIGVLVAIVLAAAVTIAFRLSSSGGPSAPSGDVTLTAGPDSTVGNCEVFSGTSDLPPGGRSFSGSGICPIPRGRFTCRRSATGRIPRRGRSGPDLSTSAQAARPSARCSRSS